MGRLFEDFMSKEWNLYGLQALAGILVFLMINSFLPWVGIIMVGVCMYIVGICQRILGIRFGMLYYDLHKRRMVNMMNKLDEVMDSQDKKKKKVKVKRRKKK